ncbi:MAG TPA: membrane protein insertase YidC [Acidimicrobiales bacterium]
MFHALGGLLAFFYDLVPSYAAAIALLTLTVMAVLTPLTWKSTRSMLEMQRLQPEIKKLQQQHKGDRQKLNEEMMAFYKEHKVNPVAGCLPMLLQMPVLIVMYQVIRGLTKATPKYLDESTKLYQDLVADKGRMIDFGVDLARKAGETHPSLGKAIPYFVLVAAVVIAQYVQTKQMQGRNKNAAPNPQMQMMTKVMPLLFGFISFTIAAGVNVYFLVSALFRIGQQELMYRFDPVLKKHVAEQVREVEAKAYEKPKGGPGKSSQAPANGKGPKNPNKNGKQQAGGNRNKGRSKKGR